MYCKGGASVGGRDSSKVCQTLPNFSQSELSPPPPDLDLAELELPNNDDLWWQDA